LGLLGAALFAPTLATLIDYLDGGSAPDVIETTVPIACTTALVCVRFYLLHRDRGQMEISLGESEQRYRELFQDANLARDTLAAQNVKLREVDKLKDDLIALVSHELRTPLTSIIGYLELVNEDRDSLSTEQGEFLDVVDRNANRLLTLVSDLLFVAQAQAGRLSIEKEPLDTCELVSDAVAAAKPFASERKIELTIETSGEARVNGDAQRLGQVVDNLLSNALKFTPHGGAVHVDVTGEGDDVVISVTDDGMGISPADQDELFARFFRTEAAMKKAIQGTGLGLSIVKAIVEAHDGQIAVDSVEGEGATFRVTLPSLAAAAPLSTPTAVLAAA
jgi:signal transduction histidine kinase